MAAQTAARGAETALHGGEHMHGAGYQKGATGAGNYGTVVLTVKSAHSLRDTAWIGKADPYCEITVADATISTNHVRGAGEAATWDESFKFRNVAPDDVIEFHVYDKNRVRADSHMGEGTITLRQVFDQGRMETRIPLSTRTGTKDAGELWISLRMEEEGGATGAAGAGMGYSQKAGYESRETGYEAGTRGQEYTRGQEELGSEVHQYGTAPRDYGATEGVARQTEGGVCGQEYFTKVEDRPIVKERVTYVKEHRPVEKEFVVETRNTGVEREAAEGRVTESLGTEEHVVSRAAPKSPCA